MLELPIVVVVSLRSINDMCIQYNSLQIESRYQIIQNYFESRSLIREMFRRLREFDSAHNRPSEQNIHCG